MMEKTQRPSEPPTEQPTSPGWVYDYYTQLCLGPASYEQAELYKKYSPGPMPVSYAGGPQRVVIRGGPRKAHLMVNNSQRT